VSRAYDASEDYRNWWNLGGIVEFDGPHGGRLRGEIVRVSSNPGYFHVEVDGRRYEVFTATDNIRQVGGW
jgi:hypothetical protein